jgi:hypothetical protein
MASGIEYEGELENGPENILIERPNVQGLRFGVIVISMRKIYPRVRFLCCLLIDSNVMNS